jgi:hypothetical protein
LFTPDNPLTPPGPTFEEPWHAQVLAIADVMVTNGQFTAVQWAETLGDTLRATTVNGLPDTPQTYYEAALQALETLTSQETPIDPTSLSERKDQWARAYLATPHGKPVLLSAGKT